MKTQPAQSRSSTVSIASTGVEADAANVWHPTMREFAGGVEVTEVVDTLPGELLELFKPAPPAGTR